MIRIFNKNCLNLDFIRVERNLFLFVDVVLYNGWLYFKIEKNMKFK